MKRELKTRRLCLAMLAASALGLAVNNAALANARIYDRALASTGWIIVPQAKSTAIGTCWVVDQERKLVVTSLHVMKGADELLVYFPQHAEKRLIVESASYLRNVPAILGRVVAKDEPRDLALIQLETLPEGIAALPLARDSARPGEDVHSIGNSGLAKNGGVLWRYTRGNVRQVYVRKTKGSEVRILETQSPVNQGDSGGALLNDQGEVVGVAAAYDPKERLVSHSIDVNDVRVFVKDGLAALDQNHDAEEPRYHAARVQPLVGSWKIVAKLLDGTEVRGEAEFRKDGTYQLLNHGDSEDEKSQQGRFAYANGVLWLISDDGASFFSLDWGDKNRFSCKKGEVELSFAR